MGKRKYSTAELLRRFAPYYKKYISTVVFDLFCATLTTVCELVLPMIVRRITSTAQTDLQALTAQMILTATAIYVLLRIIDTVSYYYMASVGHIMGTKIETDMRKDFFAHLQKLSFSYYDNTKVGTLMSRITGDLFDVTEFAHHCPEEFFIAAIKIIGAFVILCTVNVPLTLIVFALVPIMIVVLSKFNLKLRYGFAESRRRVAELNSQVEDSLLGVREVKAYANEPVEEHKFKKGNLRYLDIKTKVYHFFGFFYSSTRFFDGLLYIIVVCVGAFFLKNGKITVPDFVAYILYVSMLLAAVRRIVEYAEQFQRGMTGIERFCEVMDVEPDISDAPDAKELDHIDGVIDMNDVTFKYSSDTKDVISHLNLHINRGESVAIVGPSGGGKTTLCALIPRFYDLTDGEILVDGMNVKDVTLSSLRRNIGVVNQDVYLFSGSVRENIEYGKLGATDEEIVTAAKLAGADEFISSLPDGYDTYVGERGVKLSGGQKQRIAIARVFLKNPPVLILDEATSALDNESELVVQQSLERLAKGRTTLTVAHRLTTIKNADRIIVLTEDGIVEEGTHAELIEKQGVYADLYKLYSTK